MNTPELLTWDNEQKKFISCKFNKILVTGPQRSGTRFVTYVLATDLQLAAYLEPQKEEDFEIITEGVWQGPKLSHKVHKLKLFDCLVVWVIRKTDDVLASENRINWKSAIKERGQLPEEYRNGILCEQRYKYWFERQRNFVPYWVEVQYESLKGHNLWVSPEERTKAGGFDASRTRL